MDSPQQHKYVIRAAVLSEAELLSGLALRSKAYWDYSPEFIEACREELSCSPEEIDCADFIFAVAEIAGVVIGFYALKRLSPTEIELESLFVEPDRIGQGIGRALMDHAKTTAANLGGKSLVMQGDPNAKPFYLAAGGVPTGKSESSVFPGRYLPTFAISLEKDSK